MLAWSSPLGQLAPRPDGEPLTVSVPCRTRRSGRGRRHDVTVHPDWSVTTPHDLEAERVGVALGGYLSCLDLVDHAVPAARDLLQLVGRRVLPPLARNHVGRWVVGEPTAGCSCRTQSCATPYEAAEHVRSPAHLARRYGADPSHVQLLVGAAAQSYGGFQMCPPPGWVALESVSEPRGIDALWGAGVPPELVLEIQDRVLPGRRLPASAYLGAAYRCEDLAWLADTVAAQPDPDVVVWAAWSYGIGDRSQPDVRREWLAVGVPRSAIDVLVDGGLGAVLAEELAERTGRTLHRAALVLAAWERAGCRPGPGDIAALDVLGIGDSYEPSGAAVASLCQASARLRPRPTPTQAAVLLGLAGTRQNALALVKDGVVSTPDALEVLTGVALGGSARPGGPSRSEDQHRRKVGNG